MKHFNLISDYVYLDNAASTPPLIPVKKAVDDFLYNYGSIHRGSGVLSEKSTDAYEKARKDVADCIDAKEGRDVVIFTSNTTDAINRFAQLFPFKGRDTILISDIEHSSNMLPWLKHARVETFKTDDDYKIHPNDIARALGENEDIKIVAISGASNLTGYITPVKAIYEICRNYGVYLFIDASQLAPHFPVSLDFCDFIAFSGHKMYAPYGGGVLAGRKSVLQNVGLSSTGGGNVIYVYNNIPIYKSAPYKHEAGTPNGVGAISIAAALNFISKEIGWDKVIHHNQKINQIGYEYLHDLEQINLYFPTELDINLRVGRTPIFVFDSADDKISTKNLANLIAKQNIGIRCGTFCLYKLVERMKGIESTGWVLRHVKKHKELPPEYDLIRASAGLMTREEDFAKLRDVIKRVE